MTTCRSRPVAALDFELEVAVIGGRAGPREPAEAGAHIAGYALFNDWSARDLQAREMQVSLGPCKGKDTASTLGPWLVTPDELAPYRDPDGFLRLALRAAVNGEVVGRDLLSNMSWTFEEMISYASRGGWVRPGDVLGSGTCGNGGCLAELWGRRGEQVPPPLRPGDIGDADRRGHRLGAQHGGAGRDSAGPASARPRPRTRKRTS